MKMFKKAVPCFLVFVLCLTTIPVTPAMAASSGHPKTLDMSKLAAMGAKRDVTLKIGDLTFYGKLAKDALTDKEIDDVIAQVASDLKMNVDEFNKDFDDLSADVGKYNDDQVLTPAEYQKWKSDVLTIASAFGGPVAGNLASALALLDSAMNGSASQFMTDAGKEGVMRSFGKAAEILGESAPAMAAEITSLMGWAQAFIILNDRFQQEQGKWQNMKNGLDALRGLQELYKRINNKLAQYQSKTGKKSSIVFDHANDFWPVTLYGVTCKENWNVQMTLNQKTAASSGDWKGTYSGDYTIVIQYDLTALADKLPDLLQTPEWRGTGANDAWAFLENGFTLNWTLAKPGQWIVTRTLKGQASATVASSGSMINVTLEKPPSDEIDDASVTINMNGVYDHPDNETFNGATYKLDMVVSMDEQGFEVKYGADEAAQDIKVPANETVLKRGNEAKKGGWTLKVS